MSTLKDLFQRFPNLIYFLVLAIGISIIIGFAARDVGLLPLQWFWLIAITTGVAALCVWIISWEDGEVDADGQIEE